MNTETLVKAIRLIRSIADELEMQIPLNENPMLNECIFCDYWNKQFKRCGKYNQVPPEHVMKEPWKYCKDCTTIPF